MFITERCILSLHSTLHSHGGQHNLKPSRNGMELTCSLLVHPKVLQRAHRAKEKVSPRISESEYVSW